MLPDPLRESSHPPQTLDFLPGQAATLLIDWGTRGDTTLTTP